MKNNYKTIISKLYELPGYFYIEIREAKKYTEFYMLNSWHAYTPCIFKAETETLIKDLDLLVLELFLRYYIDYLKIVNDFEETIDADTIKRRIKEKDYISPTERAVLVYKYSNTYTVEVTDELGVPGNISFYLTHKKHPDFKIEVYADSCEQIEHNANNDIIHYIEINESYFKEEYKQELKYYNIVL